MWIFGPLLLVASPFVLAAVFRTLACYRRRRILQARLERTLALDTYPAPLRAEVEQAVRAIASMRPLPAPRAHSHTHRPTHTLAPAAPRLIALYGKGRSGKTTLAEFMERRYPAVAHFGFSAPMIDEANELLRGSGHRLTDHNKADVRYRALLQAWAHARRFEDPNYWLTPLGVKTRNAWADGARLVILAGLRELDEKAAVEAWGGEVWKLVRPDLILPDAVARHPNETALDDLPEDAFAHVIVNDGDEPLALHRAVAALLDV